MWLGVRRGVYAAQRAWRPATASYLRAFHACAARFDAAQDPRMPDVAAMAKEAKEQAASKEIKRFWKDVHLKFETPGNGDEDHFVVQLDRRNIRTPDGHILAVPADRPLLACLIGQEWDEQTQVLRSHSLPLTSLMARAIDGLDDDTTRKGVEEYLMRYFDTDAVCFFESEPPRLAKLQQERWVPIIDWARRTFDVKINTAHDALACQQPPETRAKIARVIAGLQPLDLASLERAVMTSKSMLIGLSLIHRHIEAEQAALAAEVETASQASAWGAIDDSHDVDHAQLRRQLASVACAQVSTEPELVEKFVEVLRKHDGAFRT